MGIVHFLKKELKRVPGMADLLAAQKIAPIVRSPIKKLAGNSKVAISSGQIAGEVQVVHGPDSRVRYLPQDVAWATDRIFTEAAPAEYPECFLVRLPDGGVWDFCTISKEGALLADVSYEPGLDLATGRNHSFLARRFSPAATHLEGTAVNLCTSWAHIAFYHWMIELLPRFSIAKEAGVDLEKATVLVNSLNLPFQRESLRIFNISRALAANGLRVSADEMCVPSLAGITSKPPRWAVDFLRDSFFNGARKVTVECPSKIYISRGDTGSRRVLNEVELTAQLARRGFVAMTLSKYHLLEQVALFMNASHIVAPHGGGLTNIVFCNAGCRVVELFGPKYVNPCYWSLAELVGLDYHAEIAPGVREYLYDGPRVADDYEVDVERVLQAVER